jgi:cytochrome c553
MRRVLLAGFSCVLIFQMAPADTKPAPNKQIERGRELFAKSPKGTPCATCHQMAGIGTAVGPDLTKLASVAIPRGLVAAIHWTIPENVQEVKTRDRTFPAVMKQKQGDHIEVWDLSENPPVLRDLTNQVLSMTRTDKWSHPPTSANYTSQELADIIAFLRWVANGSEKEIKVADIE